MALVFQDALGGDDPVFGFLCGLKLQQFFDQGKLSEVRARLQGVTSGIVLVVGCGASLIADPDVLVYADLARWEAQNRFRRNQASNLGAENPLLAAALQYKRAFFVDWRAADRLKKDLLPKADFMLDTNAAIPKLVSGRTARAALRPLPARRFRAGGRRARYRALLPR